MKVLCTFKGDDVLVDDDVYSSLKDLGWTVMHGVVRRHLSKYPPRSEQLNRRITGATEDLIVMHLDGDKFNCQRSNLRAVSRATWKQRIAILTDEGYRGVLKYNKKYRARINTDDGHKTIGVFETAQEAADAYDVEAEKEFGDMALLNRDISR